MWALRGRVKVFLATAPVDGRNGINGLVGLVSAVVEEDPHSGHACVFVRRQGDLVKVLLWDRGGNSLLHKRPEQSRFKVPKADANTGRSSLSGVQLSSLLDGMDWMAAHAPRHWEPGRTNKRAALESSAPRDATAAQPRPAWVSRRRSWRTLKRSWTHSSAAPLARRVGA